jgi:hypothetical protein
MHFMHFMHMDLCILMRFKAYIRNKLGFFSCIYDFLSYFFLLSMIFCTPQLTRRRTARAE